MAKDWKSYERTIAKQLGSWWGCVFRRTPSSGAWSKQGQSRFATTHDAASPWHGDIVAPPEARFPFSVECKTYKNVELYQLLTGKSTIFSWWVQCVNDEQRVKLQPMLVFKENYKRPLVAISIKAFEEIHVRCPQLQDVRRFEIWYKTPKGFYKGIAIFDFETFLKTCSKSAVVKALGYKKKL